MIYNTESETLINHDKKLQPDFSIETEAILPSSSDMMESNVFFITLPFMIFNISVKTLHFKVNRIVSEQYFQVWHYQRGL